jgi:hypothetical protein
MPWEIIVRVDAEDLELAYAQLSNRLDGWDDAVAVRPSRALPEEEKDNALPTLMNVEEAKQAVLRPLVGKHLLMVPPELAVQLPNILRCLRELEARKQADTPA